MKGVLLCFSGPHLIGRGPFFVPSKLLSLSCSQIPKMSSPRTAVGVSFPAKNRHPESDRLLKAVLAALTQFHFEVTVVPPSESLADCEARLARMCLSELSMEGLPN
jgi:hypothetical protein